MSTPSNRHGCWKPTANAERNRLSASGGFRLVGSSASPLSTRTRGMTRSYLSFETNDSPDVSPTPKRPRVLCCDNTMETSVSSVAVPSIPGKSSSVPQPTRVLLELQPLKEQMESLIRCPVCGSSVVVTFPTTTIASGCKATCEDEMCLFINNNAPILATAPQPATHQGSAFTKRIVNYEANVLCVLSFLVCGDGGIKAGRVLALWV